MKKSLQLLEAIERVAEKLATALAESENASESRQQIVLSEVMKESREIFRAALLEYENT